MRICVFGAGSLGSALGGILASSHEVTLVGRRSHMSAVRRKGLSLEGDLRKVARLEARVRAEGMEPPELLVISTKAYDTRDAVQQCRSIASRNTMVLTLQNGLGNLDLLRSWKGSNAFGGTTTMGANLVAPGRVRISGLGKTVIGSDLNPVGARRICAVFSECGIPAEPRDEIDAVIWSKVAVSAAINPLTAILRVENGKLLSNNTLKRIAEDTFREAIGVGIASGVSLDPRKTLSLVREVAKDTAANRSSMLQDVEHGRRTEIEQISGAIWRLGERVGSPAPLNKAMWAMVSSIQYQRTSQKA